ncbi:protein lifeguard 1-like [Episyrphus balteatus]|uniref:protein lifeguard 1-like n=1 Tax=Episyrphus balteatus TaxID=286459 RepID=UPI0024866B9C|nr:protein lifeguard 1-like [Episyrphus balteatus]
MDSDPMSPKNQPHQIGFQGGNQGPSGAPATENQPIQGYPPAVPVFGFVEPPRPSNNYGGPDGIYPAPSGGFDPQGTSVGGNYNKLVDPESQKLKNFSFTDQSIRRAFIRKVYSILMCQLLVTFGVVALFVFHMPTQEWATQNRWLLYGTMITILVSTLLMGCFEEFLRKTPSNFMFLGFFTVCQSILVGYVCTIYDPETVILAVGVTTVLCLGLTLFALQSKYDFTTCGGILLTALLLLLIVGLVSVFFPDKRLKIVYSAFGAMLFSFYLIYDTQLMLGGEHKYAISPEDYIFAAINIYLDIINLFLYILRIVGSKK